MSWRHENIARPLLSCSRQEIDAYVALHNIPFREDKSNQDNKYRRNLLRNEVFPLLEQINSGFVNNIANTTAIAREAEHLIAAGIERYLEKIVSHSGNIIRIKSQELLSSPAPKTLVWHLIKPLNFTSGQLEEVLALASAQTGKHVQSTSHLATAERGEIMIAPISQNHPSELTFHSLAELAGHQEFLVEVTPKPTSLKQPLNVALIDSETLVFPITLRTWKEGDRIKPLGMTNNQKVSDLLTQAKVPASIKQDCLVLESDGKIIWVIGHRIHHDSRIQENSESCTKITYIKM